MANYDFFSLDDKEFESLVAALLGAEENVRYETFKLGKDGGVDGRYLSGPEVTIVQCKHWARSGISTLLRELAKTEVDKVKAINPNRFVLATSLPLSAANKKAISEIFHPYIKTDKDVFGKDDLNAILTKFPGIERATTKLWLHSAEILNQFGNMAIRGRSGFAISQIREGRDRYIETAAHITAHEKLSANRVVLITGEPGIGKTTLAEQLCLDYVLRGFQLCVAAREIEELEQIFTESEKQIFYFDDFLGRTFLEAINHHEDSHITGFIKRIRSDPNKRFILTSRTNILNQGKLLADIFRIENIDRHELELRITDLTELDRAKILHSCIWYSSLPAEFVEKIVHQKKYWVVIKHSNFNPRLISFVTDPMRLGAVSPENYWGFITATLSNPADVWGPVYDSQLSDCQRAIVLLVSFAGREIVEDALQESYDRLLSSPHGQRYTGDRDFNRNIKLLVGSLINRSIRSSDLITYTLFNPSIADFTVPRISSDRQLLSAVICSLRSKATLEYFERLITLGRIKKPVAQHCVRDLELQTILDEPAFVSVAIEVLRLAIAHDGDSEITKSSVKKAIHQLTQTLNPAEYLAAASSIIEYAFDHELIDDAIIHIFFNHASVTDFCFQDLGALNSLVASLWNVESQNEIEIKAHAISLAIITEVIQDEVKELDALEDFYDSENISALEEKLKETIISVCAGVGVMPTSSEVIDMMAEFDFDEIIDDNITRSMNDSSDDYKYGRSDNSQSTDIDDLFNIDLPPSENN